MSEVIDASPNNIDKQQRFTVYQGELCSISYNNLKRNRI